MEQHEEEGSVANSLREAAGRPCGRTKIPGEAIRRCALNMGHCQAPSPYPTYHVPSCPGQGSCSLRLPGPAHSHPAQKVGSWLVLRGWLHMMSTLLRALPRPHVSLLEERLRYHEVCLPSAFPSSWSAPQTSGWPHTQPGSAGRKRMSHSGSTKMQHVSQAAHLNVATSPWCPQRLVSRLGIDRFSELTARAGANTSQRVGQRGWVFEVDFAALSLITHVCLTAGSYPSLRPLGCLRGPSFCVCTWGHSGQARCHPWP